ncbi:DUF4258 domain-containing protein [Patescibacteria group bacterium]|nr:DUF4258 domain-containing protein [Patescibacteria group bacterium]
MKIVFTKHSLERAKERAISEKELRDAIYFPNKIDESSQDNRRFLIKKIYYNKKLKAEHLLMIICEKEKEIIKIITIIDTSKISKYY